MKKLILTLIIMLLLANVAGAMDIEALLLGEPKQQPKAEKMAMGSADPVSLLVGIGVGPDFDSPDNEFNLLFGLRYNLLEIGPKVYLWPNGDDHTVWGVYVLRHLTYDPILIGTPLIGFETTVGSSDGDMYAFVSGVDTEIQPGIIMRTTAKYRTFDGALADSHDDSKDEIVAGVEVLFKF